MATAAHPAVVGVAAPGAPLPSGIRPTLLALAAAALGWEAVSRFFGFPFMPPLGDIVRAVWRMTLSGEIAAALASSLGVLTLGFSLAVVAGVPLGLALGRYRLLAYVCNPYLDALLAVPSILLVPVFFGVFGLSRTTQVASVFVYSVVVIVYMTRGGLATLDAAYVEMARAFGATERQIVRRVLLPAALPTVMAGLRLGIGRAVRGTINAEMLVGPFGLGALLRQHGARLEAASVYGILGVLVLLALAANHAVHFVDRRLNRWAG